MNSGEEIVGKVVGRSVSPEGDAYYEIEAPLGTAMTPQGVQLMQSLFTIDMTATVNMYISSIAIIGVPHEELLEAYRESTTGIHVPKKQILMS